MKKWSYSLALCCVVAACGGSDTPSQVNDGGAKHADAATHRDASNTTGNHADAGTDGTSDDGDTSGDIGSSDPSDDSNPSQDGMNGGGAPGQTNADAGSSTRGGDQSDAGVLQGAGSCCEAHDGPGCGNADLEVCVCELDSTCCTVAWGKQCAFIVEQKYCQPGVRDCVCKTGTGQWGQSDCCDADWTTTCDLVATSKCNAVQGCF